MLDPPFSSAFTWDDLEEMPVPSLAADPSFVFLWVGSGAGEGLERGREILAKWGYRRCEDVTWVKTNRYSNLGPGTDPPTTSLLTRTKQHCLIGIRGTVRRSTDNWFVHCNVDTDVILWEGDTTDPIRKPPEIYSLVENFCLGLRRLDIFGRAASSLRRGWLTVFTEEQYTQLLERVSVDGQIHVEPLSEETAPSTARKWEKAGWEHGLKELAERAGGKMVVPHSDDIEMLRPKSPAPKHRGGNATGGSTGGNTDGAFRFQNQNQMRQPQPQPPFMSGPINMMGTQSMMMDGGMQMPMGMFGQMPMMMNAAQYGMNPMVTAGGLGEQWMDQQNELGNWDPTMQGMQGMSGMQGMHGMQGMPGMQGMQGHWEGQGGFS
ncbi:MT-A70-domain-containing protein [Flagelloscypha sp. PMI_526]|nr:MT-A70-domain-containing protein [Flagelloscypha sp. PMI_526]